MCVCVFICVSYVFLSFHSMRQNTFQSHSSLCGDIVCMHSRFGSVDCLVLFVATTAPMVCGDNGSSSSSSSCNIVVSTIDNVPVTVNQSTRANRIYCPHAAVRFYYCFVSFLFCFVWFCYLIISLLNS